ncbi:MAG: flagellar hook-length control protein FliK [Chloroflexota bacterium]
MDSIAPILAARIASSAEPGLGLPAPGSIVRATVISVDGKAVKLRMGDQTINATAETPVTPGETLKFRFEQSPNGKALLRMVDDSARTHAQAAQSGAGRVPMGNGSPARPSGPPASGPQAGPSGPASDLDTHPLLARFGGASQASVGTQGTGERGGQVGSATGRAPDPGQPHITPPNGDSEAQIGQMTLPSRLATPPNQAAFQRPAAPLMAQSNPMSSAPADGAVDMGEAPQRPASGQAGGTVPQRGGSGPGLRPFGNDAPPISLPARFALDQTVAAPSPRLTPQGRTLSQSQVPTTAPQTSAAGLPLPLPTLTQPLTLTARATDNAAVESEPRDDAPVADAPVADEQPALLGGALTRPRMDPRVMMLLRAAMPAYTQSLGNGAPASASSNGGAVASGTRSGAVPTELRAMLAEAGIPADAVNASLAEALMENGAPISSSTVATLRQQLSLNGGLPTDARPVVLLHQVGLPVTPETMELARGVTSGALNVDDAWLSVLSALESNAENGAADVPTALSHQLLNAWSVPDSDSPGEFAGWLQRSLHSAAIPPEAKVSRGENGQSLMQDARVVAHQLSSDGKEPQAALAALERLGSALKGQQMLNAAPQGTADERFFVFTLPGATPEHQPGLIELSVREREAETSGSVRGRPDVVRLKFSLPALGELAVNVRVDGQHLACHFAAGSPFVAELLTAGAGDLAERFRSLGYAQPTIDATESVPEASPTADTPRRRSVHRLDARL